MTYLKIVIGESINYDEISDYLRDRFLGGYFGNSLFSVSVIAPYESFSDGDIIIDTASGQVFFIKAVL